MLTEPQLAHLKERFPKVKSFHPIILKAESWLLDPANADRFPKRMFVFICRWIENEESFAANRADAQQTGSGKSRTPYHAGYGRKPVNRRAEQEAQEYQFEKPRGTKRDILDDVQSLGSLLNQIAAHTQPQPNAAPTGAPVQSPSTASDADRG